MSIKKSVERIFFNILCATGATITLIGVIISFWLFFASECAGKFYFCILSLLFSYVGYLIYRYAFLKINKKWSDHY